MYEYHLLTRPPPKYIEQPRYKIPKNKTQRKNPKRREREYVANPTKPTMQQNTTRNPSTSIYAPREIPQQGKT
jgi:hypothetical protein